MKNKIVLIGMPGCGKTTIGKFLAESLNYSFYDMDDYIQEISNSTVKELFSVSEKNFRDWETKACKELSAKGKCIISSGGGVVKKDINIDILKQTSYIIFINRSVEDILKDIDSDSRPLLKDDSQRLYKLYDERIEKYKKAADIEIVNKGYLKDVIELIQKEIKKVL